MFVNSEEVEGILSPDEGEGSCRSSRMSTKSEKNMADFEGEEFISDEELARINGPYSQHQMQQHLSSLASMYQTHLPQGKGLWKFLLGPYRKWIFYFSSQIFFNIMVFFFY